MLKQILSLLVVCTLMLSLAACGSLEGMLNALGGEETTEEVQETTTVPEATRETLDTVPPVTETTAATAPLTKVDLAILDSIQAQDSFPVKISKITPVEGLFDDGSFVVDLDGEDGFLITVENNTEDTVSQVSFLMLATDENGQGRSMGLLNAIPWSFEVKNYSDYVGFYSSTAEIAAGETSDYGAQCSFDTVANLNAIVYSYVDSEGNEIINENCYEWLINTLEK